MKTKQVFTLSFGFLLMACGGTEEPVESSSEPTTPTTSTEEGNTLDDSPTHDMVAFLTDYDVFIEDREEMKTVLKKTGFISYDQEDENTSLHHIQYNENENRYYYDPCLDEEGSFRFISEESEDYAQVPESDQPSFYSSNEDRFGWKIIRFEQIENGVLFNLEGDNEKTERKILASDKGYWIYHILYNEDHSKDQYLVTKVNLHMIKTVASDCE